MIESSGIDLRAFERLLMTGVSCSDGEGGATPRLRGSLEALKSSLFCGMDRKIYKECSRDVSVNMETEKMQRQEELLTTNDAVQDSCHHSRLKTRLKGRNYTEISLILEQKLSNLRS